MKNKNINNTLLALAMSSVLTACGGSSDSTDDVNNGFNNTPDQTAPIITLNGSSSVSILINDDYQDLGATASDAVDGSVAVNNTGFVDTSTGGNYTITYNAVDAAGNAASQITRTVKVIDGTPIDTPQKLYGVEYDIFSGFDFYEITINEPSLSFVEGTLVNNAVTFPAMQGDLYHSFSAGEWVGRNPSSFGLELVELNTVGVIDGIRKLVIDSIQFIEGQNLVVNGNEIDNNLPEGSARYTIKTELLEDAYAVYNKVSSGGVILQTLDEVLTNGCGDTDLIDDVDSDQLSNVVIPCSQINQAEGTLTGSTPNGSITDAGIWSVGKIPGSEIDVLKITINPLYLRADSSQLTEHAIFAIKDGQVWTGEMTVQGATDLEVYYNRTAIENRILNSCFEENTDGNYIDC